MRIIGWRLGFSLKICGRRSFRIARKSRKEIVASELFGADIAPEKSIRGAEKIYKTAIYVRLSREEAGKQDGETMEMQKYLLLSFIKKQKELRVAEVYEDNGKSGTTFERPEFIRMMKEVKEGSVDCILVKDLSRLGRNYLEVGEYLEHIFPKLGVRFIALNDGYDNLHTEENETLAIPLKNLINDIYAKDISRKVRSTFRMKQGEGKFLGNYPPYGYLKDPVDKNHLILDEETAPIVRLIFEWKAAGTGTAQIARRLNSRGILSITDYRFKKGIIRARKKEKTLWHTRVIDRDILKNQVYLGKIIQGRYVSEIYRGVKRMPVPEEEWYIHENMHEALVSHELFLAAHKVRKERCGRNEKK